MVIKDILNPTIVDYAGRIADVGYNRIRQRDTMRLNDFTDYLYDIAPHGNFAFYPLCSPQNVGGGYTGLGMGKLAKNTHVNFGSTFSWDASGAYFDSLTNCAEIEFSGANDFQFRRGDCSVFYVFRHTRAEGSEETLFRAGAQSPYMWFDNSPDQFGVFAPEFSTDARRPRGTTYIYDEIFGMDKKGMSIGFSAPPLTKVAQPASFRSLGDDFLCMALGIDYSGYQLRAMGADNIDSGVLASNFLPSYETYYPYDFLPTRMVLGAGADNTHISYKEGGVAGVPHKCAGVLILSGKYPNQLERIARKMVIALGVNKIPDPAASDKSESFFSNVSISSIEYRDYPIYAAISGESGSASVSISSITYATNGLISYILTGNTGWAVWSVETFSGAVNIPSINYITGIIESGHTSTERFSGALSIPSMGYITGIIESGFSSTERYSGAISISSIKYLYSGWNIVASDTGVYSIAGVGGITPKYEPYYESGAYSIQGILLSTG